MTARTHDLFAFASLITIATHSPPPSLNPPTTIISIIGSVIGSLLPDIDQASNRLWNMLPAGKLFGDIFRKLFIAHRTISHSILGLIITSITLKTILPLILNPQSINTDIVHFAIMIGFISHLLADAFTEEGIPLFFPLKLKIGFPPISSWRIKTGKNFEKFVVFPAILGYIIWFSINNHSTLTEIIKLNLK
jgi:inner membrane protein